MNVLDIVEKRRATLISLTYLAVFVIIFYFFVKYAFWMVSPFIFALLIALILQRPINFLSKKTHLKKKLLSVILVLLVVLIVLGLVTLVGYRLWDEFYNFGQYAVSKLKDSEYMIEVVKTKIDGLIDRLPAFLSNSAGDAVNRVFDSIFHYAEETSSEAAAAVETAGTAGKASQLGLNFSFLKAPLSGIWSTAKQIPAILTAVLISIIASFFLTSDYDGFVRLIKSNITLEHERKIAKAKHIITDVLWKWVKSYAVILFITFCEIALGLFILKLCGLYTGNYIFVIAVCTALLDILPVFGTGTVLVPWAVISLFTHKVGLGIGLIIIYVAITVFRQILEPRLVSMNVGMHPVITLMAMYLGLQIFGFLGLLILPITLVIIKTLNSEGVIQLYGRREEEETEEDEPDEAGETDKTAETADAEGHGI